MTSSTITGIAVTCTSQNTNPTDLTCIPSGFGISVYCTAKATYSDGTLADVTNTAAWSSTTATVATLGTLANGVQPFTVIGNGSTTATATLGGVTGTSATFQGAAKTVDATYYGGTCDGGAFAVYPPSGNCVTDTIDVGFSDQLKVIAPFSGTGTCAGVNFFNVTSLATWSSSNATVATVSNASGSSGLTSALVAGASTISASWLNQTGSIGLNVSSSCLKSLSIDQAGQPTRPTSTCLSRQRLCSAVQQHRFNSKLATPTTHGRMPRSIRHLGCSTHPCQRQIRSLSLP